MLSCDFLTFSWYHQNIIKADHRSNRQSNIWHLPIYNNVFIYRNHYTYSIQFESSIGHHCCQFAMSENPNKLENKKAKKDSELFHEKCTSHNHDQTCNMCDLLPKTFRAIGKEGSTMFGQLLDEIVLPFVLFDKIFATKIMNVAIYYVC